MKQYTVTRLTTETGMITKVHKMVEDFKYVHSISGLGLCWAVKGWGGTFNNSLQELWEQIKLKKKGIQLDDRFKVTL